ncbi:hypothetical protein [uncultured Salegentibacter sp.]|nr:hypothetical protein [uncultured Salegentibacter sp.]
MRGFLRYSVVPCFLIICLLVGCSDDDTIDNGQEQEFLSAQIDGEDLKIDRVEGIISCKKRLNDYGGISFVIRGETNNGEIMEIFLSNYIGPKKYTFGYDKFGESWMRYALVNPAGDWFSYAETRQAENKLPFIQIQQDDGNYVKGNFGFKAYNSIDNSVKLVSNGSFNFKLDSEL